MALLPTQRQTRGLKRVSVQQQAGNYITHQAEQRMLDLSRVSAAKWLNSINVEGKEALYFNVVDAGIDCSCRATQPIRFSSEEGVLDSGVIATPSFKDTIGDSAATFEVTKRGSTFGWGDVDSDVSHEPLEDSLPSDTMTSVGSIGSIDELFEDGADCGICHRRGLQPGFDLHGYARSLLTSLNLSMDSQCNVLNDQPDVIEVAEDGFAEWTLVVPRYYTSYTINVHNNHPVISTTLFKENGDPLEPADLYAVRGLESGIKVRCVEPQFTHVAVSFKLPREPLKISLPQLARIKDYRKFLAIPVATIIVPNTQPRCDHGDLIAVPEWQLMWKVSEVLPLTISDGYQVGWSLQARIVQPNERLWSIIDRSYVRGATD